MYRTAHALQARGHTVQVVCVERIDRGPATGVAAVDEVFEGIPVRRLEFNLAAAPAPARWEFDNPWVGDHLREMIQGFRPDLFHLVSGYLLTGRALEVAAAAEIPAVVSLTDFWFLCRRTTLLRTNGELSTVPPDPVRCARCVAEESRRYRWLGRAAPGLMDWYWRQQHGAVQLQHERQRFLLAALRRARYLISPSEFLRGLFVQAGLPAERLVYVRQGRDFEALTPERLAKAPAPELRLVYLGQIAEHKGLHVLIDALRRLPEAPIQLTLYGDPGHFPRYTRRLQQLAAGDPRIRLAGNYQGQLELHEVFQRADAMVMPSLWYENSPNVILEAFAHRTPVLASRLGGMAEMVVDGQNGLCFAPGDAADLARVLQRLLDEHGALARLSAGIQPPKTIAQELDELEAVYHRAAQEAPAGA